MQEIFTVNAGIDRIAERALELYNKNRKMVKIFVAGGSASGKSTGTSNLEKRLAELGYRVLVISADDYYKGGRIIMELIKSHGIGFDDPGAVDSGWLRSDIISLTNGHEIKEKKYKFGPDPGQETGKVLDPPQMLIIEGLFVLREDLRGLADIKVFFDIGLHGWLLRRILRDTARTGQRPKDILDYCTNVVEPKYKEWVFDTKQYADIIIRNEYDPNIEAKNTGRFEHQIKYKTLSRETDLIHQMLELGADRLLFAEQIDSYFNPKDRDLSLTGESMRIRHEADRIIWTYKGPKLHGESLIRRPKYEFEIDKKTEDAFLKIYGNEIKVIKKIRTIFLLGSMVITVDKVAKVQNGIEEKLGIFLEFRMNGKNIDQNKSRIRIERIVAKLKLEQASADIRSYVEM